MSRHVAFLFLALCACACILLCGCAPSIVYNDGLPNFYMVRPGVYRSAQPTTDAQWQRLRDAYHVTDDVKLNFPGEGSDDGAARAGIVVHMLSIQPEGDKDVFDDAIGTFKKPDPALVAEAERILAAATPEHAALVHCTWGKDRTGYLSARDRVLHDHWSKAAAYSYWLRPDPARLGFGFSPELRGLHDAWEDWKP